MIAREAVPLRWSGGVRDKYGLTIETPNAGGIYRFAVYAACALLIAAGNDAIKKQAERGKDA